MGLLGSIFRPPSPPPAAGNPSPAGSTVQAPPPATPASPPPPHAAPASDGDGVEPSTAGGGPLAPTAVLVQIGRQAPTRDLSSITARGEGAVQARSQPQVQAQSRKTRDEAPEALPRSKEPAPTATPRGLERALEAYRRQSAALEVREVAAQAAKKSPFVGGANVDRMVIDMMA
ncbi:MAG: hypothetical protein KDG89_15435 [Geminicoccaceae bacterium]|nr:hypothetical protein [Geminicoccaceae bacterium]